MFTAFLSILRNKSSLFLEVCLRELNMIKKKKKKDFYSLEAAVECIFWSKRSRVWYSYISLCLQFAQATAPATSSCVMTAAVLISPTPAMGSSSAQTAQTRPSARTVRNPCCPQMLQHILWEQCEMQGIISVLFSHVVQGMGGRSLYEKLC